MLMNNGFILVEPRDIERETPRIAVLGEKKEIDVIKKHKNVNSTD